MAGRAVSQIKREQIGISLTPEGKRCMYLLADIHGSMVGDLVDSLVRQMALDTLDKLPDIKRLAFGPRKALVDTWGRELKQIVEG